jgi:hypothetical protein
MDVCSKLGGVFRNGAAMACALVAAATLLAVRPSSAQTLTLQLQDGRATLIARDVTLRQILERWAAVGGTTIVNADKLPAVPVTLQFENVPERTVLDALLRDAGGYILGQRRDASMAVSSIDRILIVPARPGGAPPVAGAPRTTASRQPSTPVRSQVPLEEPEPEPAIEPEQIAEAVDTPPAAASSSMTTSSVTTNVPRTPASSIPPVVREFLPPSPPTPTRPGSAAVTATPAATPGAPQGTAITDRPGVVTPTPQPVYEVRQPGPLPPEALPPTN